MLWSFQRKRGQTDVRVTLDFFTETLEARRPWNKGFKILKENDLQTSQGFHRFASSVPFLLKLQEGKRHPNKRVNPGGSPEMEKTGDPQRRQAQGDGAWRSLRWSCTRHEEQPVQTGTGQTTLGGIAPRR